MENHKTAQKTEESFCETCVLCRKKLDIPIDQDIELRPFYVEGAGQLCYDCWHKIYDR